MRLHLFEFEDLSWFPDSIRKGGTDYLRYLLRAIGYYKPIVPMIARALDKIGENKIIDLCSGGGGAVEQISIELNRNRFKPIEITLSDKFPNTNAFSFLAKNSNGRITYIRSPVNVSNVPFGAPGFRTIFSAIHHFKPVEVKTILKDAVNKSSAIGIFDGGDKSVLMFLGVIFFHPLAFAFCTPFFRPFSFSRIFFTYFLPLIPLMTIWDGCVSILRLYKPEELLAIATEIDDGKYIWLNGKVRNKIGMKVTYLIGYPAQKAV